MWVYLSRIEGSPPKRNAPGSNPGKDATNNAESLVKSRFSAFLIFIASEANSLHLTKIERKSNMEKGDCSAKRNQQDFARFANQIGSPANRRKKAEKFLLICCVGVMMFDFYYSVRKIVKSHSYQYNSSKKERDIMKAEKYHIYLSEQERSQVIQFLIELKNDLIAQGRYTDAVDDVLIKFTKARKKKITVRYI